MQRCALCQYIKSDETTRLLYDGAFWKVVLSSDQQYLGKSFVTLKRHAASLRELTDEEAAELHNIIKSFESSLMSSYSPTHFNWSCLMNRAADPQNDEQFHVHWHAIPRYKERKEVNGVIFTDKRWPNSARNIEESLPDADTMTIIHDAITSSW
jgi:diadenosine tetraphosphate (Ap4A) HIT family hydrolase